MSYDVSIYGDIAFPSDSAAIEFVDARQDDVWGACTFRQDDETSSIVNVYADYARWLRDEVRDFLTTYPYPDHTDGEVRIVGEDSDDQEMVKVVGGRVTHHKVRLTWINQATGEETPWES